MGAEPWRGPVCGSVDLDGGQAYGSHTGTVRAQQAEAAKSVCRGGGGERRMAAGGGQRVDRPPSLPRFHAWLFVVSKTPLDR